MGLQDSVTHKDTEVSSSKLLCFIKVTKNNTKFTTSNYTCDQDSEYMYISSYYKLPATINNSTNNYIYNITGYYKLIPSKLIDSITADTLMVNYFYAYICMFIILPIPSTSNQSQKGTKPSQKWEEKPN